MSSLFSKQGAPQTTSIDPKSQAYVDQMRQQAQGFASTQNPYGDLFGQLMASGQSGFGAMTDPTQAQKFMNPYLSQMNPFFDFLRQRAQTDAQSQATLGGGGISPFDSTRAAILQGTEVGDVNRLQTQTNYGAFNDAMQRALQSGLGGLSMAHQFSPQAWQGGQLGLLNMGLGPVGTSQSTVYSPLAQLAGAGATVAAFA